MEYQRSLWKEAWPPSRTKLPPWTTKGPDSRGSKPGVGLTGFHVSLNGVEVGVLVKVSVLVLVKVRVNVGLGVKVKVGVKVGVLVGVGMTVGGPLF